jgi:RNA polymerase sigma factor (sigma-70 family)
MAGRIEMKDGAGAGTSTPPGRKVAYDPAVAGSPKPPPRQTPERPKLPLEEGLRRFVVKELRRLGAGDATDDLAADVMAKYLRHRPVHYRPWLERTLRTTLIDLWRRRRFEVELPPSSFPSDPAAGPPAPFPSALLASSLSTPAANRDVVRRLLDALTPQQRRVVLARYWEGLPSREIATRFNYRNAAVVDTILDRAERRLRDRFPGGIDAVT